LRLAAFHSLHVMLTPYHDDVHLDKQSEQKAVVVLKKILQARNEDLRSNGVRALEKIGAEARAAIPDLIETLKDPLVHIRISVARTIFAIDHNNLSGLPLLIELLDDKSDRESAIRAIEVFGEKAVPKLIEAL